MPHESLDAYVDLARVAAATSGEAETRQAVARLWRVRSGSGKVQCTWRRWRELFEILVPAPVTCMLCRGRIEAGKLVPSVDGGSPVMRAGAELTMVSGSQKRRAAVTRAGPGGGVALQANWCQRVRHFRTPGPPLTLLSTRRDRLLMIGDALRARMDRADTAGSERARA